MLQQKRLFIALVFAVSCRVALSAAPVSRVREVHYQRSADHTQQPAMFYTPAKLDAVPLLVVLHTWHSNYKQTYQSACADWCVKKDWAYLHPDFRGPNTQPEATGSELVV